MQSTLVNIRVFCSLKCWQTPRPTLANVVNFLLANATLADIPWMLANTTNQVAFPNMFANVGQRSLRIYLRNYTDHLRVIFR